MPVSPQTPTPLISPHHKAEAVLLGVFMLSAVGFTSILEHPASPLHSAILSESIRRAFIGLAMGLTAVCLIYSPLGKRSGAHMNPAFTLSALRLGHINGRDAVLYIFFQFLGGAGGMLMAALIARPLVGHPSVHWVATEPRPHGIAAAWVAEFVISATLMGVVLTVNRIPILANRTGWIAGLLVATFITFEAPFSGMSMNPARSMASAVFAGNWAHLWVYFTAPVAGMLLAVELHRWLATHPHLLCARLHHHDQGVFRCNCKHA